MLNLILVAIIAAFIAYEAVAHFEYRNERMRTLSNWLWRFELKYGWPARVLVAVAVLALGIHLEGAF